MNVERLKDRLVLAALPHVAFDGWSAQALAEAARDEGIEPGLAARAFPSCPRDPVLRFAALADRLMLDDLRGRPLASMRVPERIAAAIRVRLERWHPHREAVRRAVAVMALPSNLGDAALLAWNTADAIWNAAGDRSLDWSRYTKRSTLAAVYTATLLYWLDDPSEDAHNSWAFLDRRLAEIGRLRRLRGR